MAYNKTVMFFFQKPENYYIQDFVRKIRAEKNGYEYLTFENLFNFVTNPLVILMLVFSSVLFQAPALNESVAEEVFMPSLGVVALPNLLPVPNFAQAFAPFSCAKVHPLLSPFFLIFFLFSRKQNMALSLRFHPLSQWGWYRRLQRNS